MKGMSRSSRYKVVSLGAFFLFALSVISVVLAQDIAIEKLAEVEIDQMKVIHAVDGYMLGPTGDEKYFIFGAVRLHKPGAPETEWTNPIFYFEFDDKAILAGTASYHYFMEEKGDGTLKHLPVLRELWSTSSGFELDFVFTKAGKIDTSKSSISIVPDQYKTGRDIKQLTWTGEYYKKGNKTERFVPIRDEEGKVINQDEAGELVIEEMSVHVLEVCYEEIIGRDIYYLKANLGNLTYHNSTGLCPVYKIQSIFRSAGLPSAYALGLITTSSTTSPSNRSVEEESKTSKEPKEQESELQPDNTSPTTLIPPREPVVIQVSPANKSKE